MIEDNLSRYPARLPTGPKFKGLSIPFLGLGTIWFGRRWPVENKDYEPPSLKEIDSYLSFAYESGIRMFDTAAAYGNSEKILGNYFKMHPEFHDNIFISTKWGEDFEQATETSTVIHTQKQLQLSIERSLSFLPKIDLLYIHKANAQIMANAMIKGEMRSFVDRGAIKYTGASLSREADIVDVLENGTLWVDFIQTSADVVENRPDIISSLFKKGVAVVVNSPFRKRVDKLTPKESYLSFYRNPCVSAMLTGTRTHLRETIGYLQDAGSKI